MGRGWMVIGMIGALGLGFGLGRMGFEPPREKEAPREISPRGGDVLTPKDVSVTETDDVLVFSAVSEEDMFVLGYGKSPTRWRPIPPSPDSFKVPKEDLGSVWGVLGTRIKPCHCTPVDPPPGWLQGFIDQTARVADFCDQCDSFRSQCRGDVGSASAARCSGCARICWGESVVASGDQGDDPEG